LVRTKIIRKSCKPKPFYDGWPGQKAQKNRPKAVAETYNFF